MADTAHTLRVANIKRLSKEIDNEIASLMAEIVERIDSLKELVDDASTLRLPTHAGPEGVIRELKVKIDCWEQIARGIAQKTAPKEPLK